MSEKKQTKQPKFFCRKAQRECIMCMAAHMKEPWKCKNLIVRKDEEGDKCTS